MNNENIPSPDRFCKLNLHSLDEFIIKSIVKISFNKFDMNDMPCLISTKYRISIDIIENFSIFIYHAYYIIKNNPSHGNILYNIVYDYKNISKIKKLFLLLYNFFLFIYKSRLINRLSELYEKINWLISIFDLMNYSVFLINNDYPSIIFRILKINLIKISNSSNNSSSLIFNYLFKKVVSEKVIEFLAKTLFFSIANNKIQSFIKKLFNTSFVDVYNSNDSHLSFEMKNKNFCCKCNEVPYLRSVSICGCIYCYVCLESQRNNNEKCISCKKEIKLK